jgi:HCOMODA/2-hydroxy-3-carboxy-muconic semialdehyde decarboxylase
MPWYIRLGTRVVFANARATRGPEYGASAKPQEGCAIATARAEGESAADLARRVRIAGRALARAGLVSAYGHCSARIDDGHFIVSPPRPLGLVAREEPCIEVATDQPLPPGAAGEVRIHQAVYRRRPEVSGICRAQPPNTMTLSVARITPRARHGFSSYFAPAPPLWDDPALVRDDASASRVAEALRDGPAIVLRGNGALTVGTTIEEATVLCWFLEDSARVELDLRKIANSGAPLSELSAAEATRRATWEGALLDRMWAYLIRDDPELDSTA